MHPVRRSHPIFPLALAPLVLLAACAQEAEAPVVENEVAPTSAEDAETIGPAEQSLADPAIPSLTEPAGEATSPVVQGETLDPDEVGERYQDHVSETE